MEVFTIKTDTGHYKFSKDEVNALIQHVKKKTYRKLKRSDRYDIGTRFYNNGVSSILVCNKENMVMLICLKTGMVLASNRTLLTDPRVVGSICYDFFRILVGEMNVGDYQIIETLSDSDLFDKIVNKYKTGDKFLYISNDGDSSIKLILAKYYKENTFGLMDINKGEFMDTTFYCDQGIITEVELENMTGDLYPNITKIEE